MTCHIYGWYKYPYDSSKTLKWVSLILQYTPFVTNCKKKKTQITLVKKTKT